ncbi:MAG: phospholipid/cholesterol/gamma-HCH transport system substrate-binding protein [Solirubrobacterales bacterium]|jgi:ABC-type transporter Mla subunit MlaD|nr:phospholipid/cholesterol/gamma-HCH transport system substrate-binding protein [Solirubrobacterales bacterium]
MALFRRDRPRRPDPNRPAVDERVWGRHYTGLSPWVFGLFIVILIAIFTYLAFAKSLPWSSPGFELHARFENAATLRSSSPVRIAGVNVGKVTNVQADGDTVDVTFSVDDEGQPIHEDAEAEIRPRLFLEGNFFVDLRPGSPSAPELADGDTIPITRTSTAVQLDEVLTALQEPTRKGLQKTLIGFGKALNYQPTAADDVGQDPDVQGQSAGESLNDAFKYGGPAGRSTAIVAKALRGENPGDLAGFISSTGGVFAKLAASGDDLANLITNFNVTAGALANESANLSATIHELPPTLEETRTSLADLGDSLPAVRALAIASRPGIQELPDTIAAFNPWLDQTSQLLRNSELGGLAKLLKSSSPGLAKAAAASKDVFPETLDLSRCSTHNLIPTADAPITADSQWGVGQPNFYEFFYGLVALAGAGQGFDGNGPYVRIQPGGGPVLIQDPNPTGQASNTVNFTNTIEAPDGIQPALGSTPPFRMDVPCQKNDVPNLNGPAAAVAPSDLTASP